MNIRTCDDCKASYWGGSTAKYCPECKEKHIIEHRLVNQRKYYARDKIDKEEH